MTTDNPASHPLCNAQYQRIGGNQPGDRVVECGRPRGHEGFHVEYCDGEDVNNWPPLSSVAVPPAEVPDECPWPVGTVLRSNGESGVFTWVFEHAVEGRWYEVGKGERQDWAYVASFPNLVELVPAGTPVVPEALAASVDDDALAGEYPYESDEYPADAVEESAAPAEIVDAAERVYVRKGGGTQGFRLAVDAVWAAALSHVQTETAPATPERVRHTWQETYWKASGRQRSTAVCTTCQMHTECGSTDYYSSCSGVMVDGR